jgi:hypothetical protein
MYIKDKSFYITPNPVVVNPLIAAWGTEYIDTTNVNKVHDGVYW